MSVRTIHKFPLTVGGICEVVCNPNPKVLRVDYQNRHASPTVWVEVDKYPPETPFRPGERLRFEVVPTGGTVPDRAAHLGTVIIHEHGLVWHVYLHHARG